MKLNQNEVELIGKWITVDNGICCDAVCERIEWLIKHQLRKVAISKQWGGWETLFQDIDDGRYWERTFPQSEMQGGGPPMLKYQTIDQAKAKYVIANP